MIGSLLPENRLQCFQTFLPPQESCFSTLELSFGLEGSYPHCFRALQPHRIVRLMHESQEMKIVLISWDSCINRTGEVVRWGRSARKQCFPTALGPCSCRTTVPWPIAVIPEPWRSTLKIDQNRQRRWWFASFISRMLSQKTPKNPGPQFPSFFSTLSFGIKKIVRLSSENEGGALPWSGCGGGSSICQITISHLRFATHVFILHILALNRFSCAQLKLEKLPFSDQDTRVLTFLTTMSNMTER